MATGRDRRAERLNERLRGAQRTNLEDDDTFGIDIAGLGNAATSETRPAPDPTPNSSAKRRKLNRDAPPSQRDRPASGAQRPSSARRGNIYDQVTSSNETQSQQSGIRGASTRRRGSMRNASSTPASRAASRGNIMKPPPSTGGADPDLDELESLPAPSSVRSTTRNRAPDNPGDEVEESPVDAPGSGRRRTAPLSSAMSSTARLRNVLESDDLHPASSSPLARKVRRSDAAASARSVRTMARSTPRQAADEVDELSPEGVEAQQQAHVQEPSPTLPSRQSVRRSARRSPRNRQESEPEEEAEEINAQDAAKSLGKKRPKPKARDKSPELGSGPPEEETEESPPARRRAKPAKSPATQKQPTTKVKKAGKRPSILHRKVKPARKSPVTRSKPTGRRRRSGSNGGVIEITVQRYINQRRRGGGSGDADEDQDPLQLDIPFANRNSESVVDVFAQVCEEVIESTMAQLEELSVQVDDRAKKKELRVKLKAVEAYREELRSRLLQHTIHLDDWHSLRKRVRHSQKEKLLLREDILGLKAEREQVALRMDAIRIKHEADAKEATSRLDASSLMHDIDLAVARGQSAAQLPPKAQKEANLANLELDIARICDQASSSSAGGGLLKQVQDFNAFLERAATALEAK